MGFIAGTKYYVTVEINQSSVFESVDDYLYCFPLAKITDPLFWGEITNQSNIGIVDAVTGLQCSKSTLGFVDTINKAGLIYWHGNTHSTAKYYICVGSSLNVADTNNTFSDTGIVQLYPCSDADGSPTVKGVFSDATIVGPDIYIGAGTVYRGIKRDAVTDTSYIIDNTAFLPAGNRTIEYLFCLTTITDVSNPVLYTGGKMTQWVSAYVSPSRGIMSKNLPTQAIYNTSSHSAFNDGGCYHVAETIKPDGKVSFIIDGALSGAEDQTGDVPENGSYIKMWEALNVVWSRIKGSMEQITFWNYNLTKEHLKTRNNMLTASSSFFGNDFSIKTASTTPHKSRVNLRLGMGL